MDGGTAGCGTEWKTSSMGAPGFASSTDLRMTPSEKLLVDPEGTPEGSPVPSGPGAQPVEQDSNPHTPILKVAVPAPALGPRQNKDSVSEARSLEDLSFSMAHPGEIAEAKVLKSHPQREGSPSQLFVEPSSPKHGSASYRADLVTARGGTFPGTKISAREGGPGSSLTLPKARAPSNPRDSVQAAKRHHSQPQVGPGHFDHVVSIKTGALSALHSPGFSKAEARAKAREEAEKMEMEEPPPTGTQEEGERPKPPRAELQEVELESKPPTPPLHRFPSWVSDFVRLGQSQPQAWSPLRISRAHKRRLILTAIVGGGGGGQACLTRSPRQGRVRIGSDTCHVPSRGLCDFLSSL